ncbi:MAG: ATP-NAD kinase family protein [Limnochordales bacterium]
MPATTGQDTRAAARAIAGSGVELLLFAGGDGTARDIFEAVGTEQVVLGIPAGVKIHSPVYANSPAQAGELALRFLTEGGVPAGQREVVDIDEDFVRRDVLQTALYGYLTVPLDETHMQNPKAPTAVTEEAAQQGIAEDVVEGMEEGTCYIIGPGTTTRAIMQALGLPCTLLGVDVVLNRRVLALDVNERDLLEYTEKYPCKLIVTPVGGQGYLLGRGNQQISGRVVKRIGKENVIIVATPGKMAELRGRPLLVDTGDAEADAMLAGFHRVKIGYWLERAHKIAPG